MYSSTIIGAGADDKPVGCPPFVPRLAQIVMLEDDIALPSVMKLTMVSMVAKLLRDRWVLIGHALLLNNVIGIGQFRLRDIESRKNGRK